MADLLAVARRTIKEYRLRQDSIDDRLVLFPALGLIDLHQLAATSATSTATQIVPFEPEGWDPTRFEHAIWREVARAGKVKVSRIYVLPHRGIAQDAVEAQLSLDGAAGIDADLVHLSDVPEGSRAAIPSGLWLVDEDIVVSSQSPPAGIPERSWVVSRRPEDLGHAKDLIAQLSDWSDGGVPDQSAVDLEEPLVLSADLIHGVADVLCAGDHVDQESCTWYHGAWQYLRLLNMVSTPTWHSTFYSQELKSALRGRTQPKAIITGTADYSLLAYLLAADERQETQVDVLDRCATPLFACRWYAKRARRQIGLLERDLFTLVDLADTYDLITTDAFLTRFSQADGRRVLTAWWRLLRSGGRVVTTVRVHPRSPTFREQDVAVRDFRERADQRLRRWLPFVAASAEEILRLTESYGQKMKSADIGDIEDIRREFERCGFRVRTEEVAEVPGELQRTTYLRIVCEKV